MNYSNFSLQKEITTVSGLGRLREWKLNKHKLITPTIFLGIDPFSKPHPWKEELEVTGLFVNSLDLMNSEDFKRKFNDKKITSLNEYLNFYGPIFADCGGFKLLNLYSKKKIHEKSSTEEVIQRYINHYKMINTDFITIPDFPYDPVIDLRENLLRFNKNRYIIQVFNSRISFHHKSVVVPVIHPFPHPYYHKQIMREFRKQGPKNNLNMLIENSPIIGIGGLIPYFLQRRGKLYLPLEKILDFVCFIRFIFPNKYLHVFGLGGSSIMPILFFLGVDSVDTMGWRIRAAYNKIQFPGSGDYSVYGTSGWSSKSIYNDKFAKKLIEECQCPACREIRDNNLDIGIFQMKKNAVKSFRLRAIHNAYIYLEEAKKIRESITKCGLESHIEETLHNNPRAKNMFKFTKKLIKRYQNSKAFGMI